MHTLAEELRGKRALLVASTGGHLAQIVKFADLFQVADDSVFATFDSPQSNSLLAGRQRIVLPYVAPRQVLSLIQATLGLFWRARRRQFDVVLTTGASVGLAAYVVGVLLRNRVIYVESVSRFDGPSTTGRIIERLPWVERYCQHKGWASRRGWQMGPSLLDEYEAVDSPQGSGIVESRSVFVSLGTIRPFRFDALIDSVLDALGPRDTVTWQLGSTTRDDLPGVVSKELDAAEFKRLVESSDAFVTHAGVGTLLLALESGVRPIAVPRRAHRAEHVDDHQTQVGRELAERGLVCLREAGELRSADLDPSPKVIRRVRANAGE